MNQNQGNNRSSRRNKSGQGFGKNIPAMLDNGTQVSVDTGNIPAGQWKHCHGTALSTGQSVNSLKIAQVGQSTIFQDESGFAASFNSNEIEVAAVALLKDLGYTVNYQK